METRTELGLFLRRERRIRNMSQAQLGKAIGIRNTTVHNIEEGLSKVPKPEVIEALKAYFNIDIVALLPKKEVITDETVRTCRICQLTKKLTKNFYISNGDPINPSYGFICKPCKLQRFKWST